ncbi:anthranilate synthase component I family protein [Bacillus luteolus]|uniref:Anthranilate synthase component I family protein n=1 Tax=Litchfieldia luteola TaxID=682179 RepID=A0ABR9QE09_9BACI|nr:anthranilate synthase component I family protein [Cytobacillus luteolus]MBE4906688.1 anthranilate synthase component I family protein [Cytobacillus luteolus]MBP1944395.1 para-aminobenzoate synthetase component 1 [Cytobacillus luteolus]
MKLARAPLARKIQLNNINWFKQYKAISKHESHHVLLESGRGGRYSIIGLRPYAILKGKNYKLEVTYDQKKEVLTGNPLELMEEWLGQFKTEHNPDYPDFQGGAIGYFSYDCARYIEKLDTLAEDDLETPDLYFLIFDDVFVIDHQDNAFWIITHYLPGEEEDAKDRIGFYEQLWTNELNDDTFPLLTKSNQQIERPYSFTEEEFVTAVERIREYIAMGDVFQVNLSVRQSRPLQTHPLNIYETLRSVNPSPYMSYMQLPEFQVVSASPELLVKKKGDEISTRPIAGTRSRGRDDQEDLQLANELIENEKERAEHVMLVDLERNDLGRVSEYGSVEVNEFMTIEKYSHVMHIVSNVRGKLANDKTGFDLIKATFPGGTITGAPKVRTMEIIEELEPVRRGLYTGSIGWIGFSGDLELNITIRTLIAKNGIAHVQAGAGVVIDSNPRQEYKESLKKAIALWKAKELSEEEIVENKSMR